MAKELSICERINKCMEVGKLSVGDIAVWLGRPSPTVRTWQYWGRTPSLIFLEDVDRRLTLLEHRVRQLAKGQRLLPYETSQKARRALLKDMLDADLNRRVSRKNSAA